MAWTIPSRWKLALASTGLAAFAVTGVIGFAHTPRGRPLLAMIGRASPRSVGGCPLGYDARRSPAERDAARARDDLALRGAEPATGRPAMGFVLDAMTERDVLGWAAAQGIACDEPKAGADLICRHVASTALPGGSPGAEVGELAFFFRGDGHLAHVRATRSVHDVDAAASLYSALTSAIDREAGPAAGRSGEGSAAYLGAGALRQASAEYRFANYYAQTRATNMGEGRYFLSEDYRSVID